MSLAGQWALRRRIALTGAIRLIRPCPLPVPVAGGAADTVRVTFDDWIWLQSETRVFNRACMKRFGVAIGDVSISFEKLR